MSPPAHTNRQCRKRGQKPITARAVIHFSSTIRRSISGFVNSWRATSPPPSCRMAGYFPVSSQERKMVSSRALDHPRGWFFERLHACKRWRLLMIRPVDFKPWFRLRVWESGCSLCRAAFRSTNDRVLFAATRNFARFLAQQLGPSDRPEASGTYTTAFILVLVVRS